jgi:hypothetical protein
MNVNKLVLAYGFEYDKIIFNDHKCYICKSINNNNPVYCYPMIKDTNVLDIISKTKVMNNEKGKYLSSMDKLAKDKYIKPKWQLVIYDKDYEYYIHVLQGKKMNYKLELDL